jgi:hypothetical protein
VVVGA